MRKEKTPRPTKGEKVKWTAPVTKRNFNCLIRTVRIRDRVAKLVPDFTSGATMPYDYFWVDWNEIGY